MGAVGVHSIDQLHFMLGQKVTSVQAMTETFVKEKPMHPKDQRTEEDKTRLLPCTAEEYVAAHFRCDGGALGTFTLTGVMSGYMGGSVHVNGTKGSASLVNGKL